MLIFLLKCHGSLFASVQLTIMSARVQVMSWCQTDDTQIPRLSVAVSCTDMFNITIIVRLCLIHGMPLSQNSPAILVLCRFVMTRLNLDASLKWRHNGSDGVSNYQHHARLLNRLFSRISKKASKLRVTGLFAGNSPVTDEFPAQMASNTENVSISWRHHVLRYSQELLIHISIMCIQNVSCKMAVILSWPWYVFLLLLLLLFLFVFLLIVI